MTATLQQAASFYPFRCKRPLDIVLALVALCILWPLMVFVAIAVWLSLGRPIFYIDRRAGREGKPFNCLKFRTMTNDIDERGQPLPDEQRLTALGRFLRAASLDELPQLWNVLLGEMSLVGPRPLSVDYLERYTPDQARRHKVRPGITGWAQVNGRNAMSWERKFELDAWYVDHVTALLDATILLLTAWQLVRPRGVSSEERATPAEFLGSKSL